MIAQWRGSGRRSCNNAVFSEARRARPITILERPLFWLSSFAVCFLAWLHLRHVIVFSELCSQSCASRSSACFRECVALVTCWLSQVVKLIDQDQDLVDWQVRRHYASPSCS